MLYISSLSRKAIDAWTIQEAGFPLRVVHSMGAAGVRTVGELRTWSDANLLRQRGIGRVSVHDIHRFFEMTGRIEEGRLAFEHVREALRAFLNKDEYFVLSARYGFGRPDMAASSNYYTLQHIGNETHRTRERVRQVEESALAHLRSRLAAHCLRPFVEHFAEPIRAAGGCLACADMAPLRSDPLLDRINPCSLLLLFTELSAEPIRHYHGFFTTLAPESVRLLESRLLESLEKCPDLCSAESLIVGLESNEAWPRGEDLRKAIAVILSHHPQVAATTDGRFFLLGNGAAAFLEELLRKAESPLHFRALTNLMNDHLLPVCRKGAGFVLRTLNASPRFTRAERGRYAPAH